MNAPPNAERELLQRLCAGPASGGELARAGGLTRAAIWKRIEALRAAGIEIQAQPGRGYALAQPLEWLDAAAIRAGLAPALRTQLAGLEVAWSIDSTNSELLRRTPPARGVAVLLAERQTGGRGRRGRTWASPLAAHLYLSLDRQFSAGLARLGGLSLVAGIAVAEALREAGFGSVRLKWPNDLVVADASGALRKLGGLLVEGSGEHAGPARAVLGIGVNVRMPASHAAKIDQPWIDLQALSAQPVSRNRIASLLLSRLLPALEAFDAQGLAPFVDRYAALDALAGREIDVHGHAGVQRGVACGIADDGALRVRMDGAEQRLYAGEVSVRAA
ncbi:bifunctional biotin--[acetyl-CoA-carboxylase] ligase/biotin operon repressor BirA [Pseudoxanthomonas sangjuensis]|uniref:bifunctional biotin--[acetyl-CoA-carboxylase] ligase/biotin operon repressor BirA n=1 Tax=Pseudoxanthomonas sangjuensis TaxID=1503750 RepID=UPI0013908C06|nr:bifunctional biotin--[acetyl-CoA-carboxylase] ligase/biotin operon repressor BirA [Pseudoxanthomonas sangjuensis]KAF1713871.1 bifunctional biotin--[acetyl-CoA-carboxylase] synthetase/biotin operon repressor [Pseudoxanthomonas sangjuensis]